jgi:hypothetical protein
MTTSSFVVVLFRLLAIVVIILLVTNGICCDAFQIIKERYHQRPLQQYHHYYGTRKIQNDIIHRNENIITKLYFSRSTTTATTGQPHDNTNNDPAEIEYRQRLKEAQIALEKVEIAKQKLLTKQSTATALSDVKGVKLSQQQQQLKLDDDDDDDLVFEDLANAKEIPGANAKISYTDANTLEIVLPPKKAGLSTLMTGAFALAWFSAITPATFAARSVAGALFMTPFWLAGGVVAKSGIVDPLVKQTLSLGRYSFSVTKEVANQTIQKIERPTSKITGAAVKIESIVNDVPRYEIQLFVEDEVYSFGLWNGYDELEEAEALLDVINQQLERIRREGRLEI